MFAPAYIRRGKRFLPVVRRFLNYRRDLLDPDSKQEIEDLIGFLKTGMKRRKANLVENAMARLSVVCEGVRADYRVSAMAECVETFFVAVVIALGCKAYFVQPYRIPTPSMYPTLNGVKAYEGAGSASPLSRAVEKILFGRTYVRVIAEQDEVIESLQQETQFNLFTSTLVRCESGRAFRIPAPLHEVYLRQPYSLAPDQSFQAGEVIVQGWIDTGDQVLVDRFSYHFVPPRRGEVIVFDTRGIAGIEIPRGIQGAHFIKRIAGVSGDMVEIEQPGIYVNGSPPAEFGLLRVMRQEGAYNGYQGSHRFLVPDASYLVLGDNSFESQDSRFWGFVPRRNLQGRAALVYWPFSANWGPIR